jgi:molybdopterin-containing oxidoreductase family iron-sulfur binding subunit
MRDPASEIAQRKQSPLQYALLAEQNTHPRLTYEARIDNPNPALGKHRGDV